MFFLDLFSLTGGATLSKSRGVALVLASHFTVTQFRVSSALPWLAAGSTTTFTIQALDARNRGVNDYGGSVHVRSSDYLARLPMFVKLVKGFGRFTVTFRTPGLNTVMVTDLANFAIRGLQTIWVLAGPWMY